MGSQNTNSIGASQAEVVDATSQWLACIGAVDVVAGRLPDNLLNGAKGLEWGKTVEEIRAALGGLELELAKVIFNGMESLRQGEDAAKSAEAANSKFAASSDAIKGAFGNLEVYTKGLDEFVGLPELRVLEAMEREHCEADGCEEPFKTSNYHIETTSKKEWKIVVDAQDGEEFGGGEGGAGKRVGVSLDFLLELAGVPRKMEEEEERMGIDKDALLLHTIKTTIVHMRDWPGLKEACTCEGATLESIKKAVAVGGKASEGRAEELVQLAEKQLERWKRAGLRREEVIALRLYTGPMFQIYNGVLRERGRMLSEKGEGGTEAGGVGAVKSKSSSAHAHHDATSRFTTTLHAINSGLLKLQAVTEVPKEHMVYRGLAGLLLPDDFINEDEFGCRGGVEFGFMSTTARRDVAVQYTAGRAMPTIFGFWV